VAIIIRSRCHWHPRWIDLPRIVHRCGDEPVWWLKVRINPMVTAAALWLKTHPLPAGPAHSRVGATEPDRAPERGVIGRVRQGWPDHHNAAILATSIVRSSQT